MAYEQNNEVKKSNGMASAALVCGILSLFFGACLGFLGITAWLGVVLGIVAVVLGVIANKKGKDGKATAGLVMGIIGLVLSAIIAISCTICAHKVNKAAKEAFGDDWEKAMKELEDYDWEGELNKALDDIDWSDLSD